ncbi:T9SS type A sorting domain-containing protein, partial [Maribacter arcticus]|uniref:T9SS type A sorting domain-containing protein n=1 Tax=Maribacter arcticus TaxID=561365 RepID=UPI003002B087
KPFPVGNYKLVANPVSGATITVNFSVVNQPDPCAGMVVSTQSKSNPTTCGGSDGSIVIAVNGAITPYTYSWNHNSNLNAANASGLSAGTYTVSVTDGSGCTKNLTVSLNNPPLPAVTLAPFANVLENSPAFALTGGLPSGGTYSGQGVTNNTFNPAGPGSYSITYSYTDAKGCSNSASRNIVVTSNSGNSALVILDATNDSPLYDLVDGLVIQKSVIGNTPLGVIYNTDFNPGGVVFTLTGPLTESRTEGPAPHSLFGDIGVDIQGKPFPVGNYKLVANPVSGATITVNFSVVDNPTLLAKKVNEMTISPNPADVIATVSFTTPQMVSTIYVYDVTGRLVKTYPGNLNKEVSSNQILVQDLPSGTYFVRTLDANGNETQQQMAIKH